MPNLTLFAVGLKYTLCFFAFQIGHIEIGKLGVFGGHFEGLRADLR